MTTTEERDAGWATEIGVAIGTLAIAGGLWLLLNAL